MPTPTLITDLSTTAASNYPAGSDSPSVLDDVQRAHGAFIAQLRDNPTANATTVTPVLKGGTGSATAAAARTNLGLVIGTDVQAYDVDTAKTDVAQTFTKGQSGSVVALTDAATIASNLSDANFFSVTLAGNRTLANPTNLVPGQSGSIFITQDGTGGRTLAFASYWDFEGGTPPVLSTGAGKVDRLDYVVRTTTSIHSAVSKDWS